MAQIINSFTKGLDMDVNPLMYDNENYYYARNFRLVVDEELSTLTLTNGKGLSLKFVTYNASSIEEECTIIGACELDTYIIIFTYTSYTDITTIFKIPIGSLESSSVYNLYTDPSNYAIVKKVF